ncbi:alpha-galactosidase [Chitinophaga sp. Cy-1792]|uniref:alpha-galactosidase n=1 Tax=Chitinophaga sp. Cy-1792 TaxID=2608339 RepID=UPI0014234A12|nr:alpha-galactosidase [Chitinophaga sp. Cy-1792]NIG54880.1 alpha-galactosidase [Chitinophaga sp. Cy-1792]
MKKIMSSLMALLLACQLAHAQETIIVSTKNLALALEKDADNNLVVAYFGQKLAMADEYRKVRPLDKYKPGNDDLFNRREAYVTGGSVNLLEPALAVTQSNGDKSLVLHYVSSKVNRIDANQTLTEILLTDPQYQFEVKLFYHTYENQDVIEQWSEILHHQKKAVVLNKYASACLTLSGNKFFLKNQRNGWGQEMSPEEQELLHGIRTIDSKLGTRTNLLHSSSFMVSMDGPATEDEGTVLAGSLEWNGNFRLDFETFDEYYLRITAGVNNYASAYTLQPNETFTTPKFVYTVSTTGRGQASRNLQRWARDYRLCNGTKDRLTILNNWETTYFDFDDQKLSHLLDDTKTLGADVFLLDDGWFGNKYPRNGATSGLGDWQVNKAKLKNGISSLGKEATEKGVKLGLWIEPEMVNPKSELYEQHPDWVLKEPGRKEYYMRNQLVLDLSNPAVQQFVYNTVENLFKEVPQLAFIKWDCNSLIYNAYSPYLKNQDHFYLEYVRGLNSVLAKVRKQHPDVPMMLCAGGGTRVDYKSLEYFTEFWASDNTNAYDRIFIQWEYSYYFPSIAVDNHVTEMGKQPIKFRTDVAMMGKLGFDLKVHELTPDDLTFCQQAVKVYDTIKHLVWHGEQYRLQDPYNNKVAAIAYVSPDKLEAVIFNYYVSTKFETPINLPIKMKGLDPSKKYSVREINLYPGTKSPVNSEPTYSGDFLMKVGFNPEATARRTSVILKVTAI